MLAEDLGLDPVDIRLKNAVYAGYPHPGKIQINSCGLREAIEAVAEGLGWREKGGKLPPGRGLGIACSSYNSGVRFMENAGGEAFIKIDQEGGVHLFSGATDIGQGTETVLCQMVAEVLGLGVEDIAITTDDTSIAPFDLGTFASGVTLRAGNAALKAAQDVKRQLLEVVGRVEGKEILNQKGVEMVVELDRPFPLPGFAPELLGLEKGGEKEFTLPFPADHPNPDLQGKEGVFRVKVLGVKERKYKPLEALVQEAGVADLAALRERVKTGLEARARAEAKRGLEEQALEALVAGARLEFPPVLVEQQIDRLLRERGIKEAGEKAREETRPVAQRQVLRGLALRKLAEVEGIKVEDREIDSEIEKMAQGRAEVKRFFASPAAHQSLRDALLLGKARERLGALASGEKEAGEKEAGEKEAGEKEAGEKEAGEKQEGGKEDASAT